MTGGGGVAVERRLAGKNDERATPSRMIFFSFTNRITKSSHEMEGSLRMKIKSYQEHFRTALDMGLQAGIPQAPKI